MVVAQQTITLAEFEELEAALSSQTCALLRRDYAGKIDCAPAEQPGLYKVAARDYVGRIALPGGVTLVITPKVGVSNLFYMLCCAANLLDLYHSTVRLEQSTDLFGIIARMVISEAQRLLKYGLYREYMQRQEDLAFVRGRILLGQQVRRHATLKHRHVCEYAELTADTPENRIVAAALRHMQSLLREHQEQTLSHTVICMLPRFESVTLVSRREALLLLDALPTHRLNAQYRRALGMCKLLLNNLHVGEHTGPHLSASFLVNMPRLFESFLTARLQAILPRHRLRVVAQQHDYLDEAQRVAIRPDLLVYAQSDHAPLLVIDAKYRRLSDEGIGLNRDLYQVSAYLDRYSLRKGVLVYPQFKGESHAELKLRGTPKHLHIIAFDLAAPTPTRLEQNCADLADQIVRLARPHPSQ